ncbi:MAG: right-handed parallel beta-helix repeat-containing protein [Anaerolineae bacterium]|nr:right-handed parallel beta-helix repeat-containing protein [Anaerolineae bacterium]
MITQRINKRNSVWLGLSAALAAITLLSLGILLTSDSLAAPPAEGLARPLNTNVSGVITQSTTWDVGGSPYVLTGDVTVNPGVTLTIAPGVIVQGADNVELTVQGNLQALGTLGQPITFTSVADSGGGQWSGLVFDGSAALTTGGGTGHLRHATVRYGGGTNSAGTYSNIAVQNALSGEVILENCQVNDSRNVVRTEYGLYINNGRVTVSGTGFSGNGNGGAAAPLYIAGASSVVTLTDNIFTGNCRDRIMLAPGAMMGHDTTLTPQTLLQGYELKSDFTVPSTVTLTLEPGVTLMGGDGIELKVQGHLQALGTPGQPITFTSVGNRWAGLVFDGSAALTTGGGTGYLRHATLSNGGDSNSTGIYSNITVQNTLAGEVHLESCQVLDSQNAFKTEYGMYVNNGRVTISDTLFSGNGNGGAAAPLYITDPDSVVTLTDNSFTGNSRDRIVLAPGAMMGHDTTLTPQTLLQGYELKNDFTVPSTVTLTLKPGVTLMGGDGIELKVQGHLQALGTPGQPITFTSVGNRWANLIFDGGTGHLRHATLRNGGDGNSAGTYSNITVQNVLAGEVRLESCQVLDSQNAFKTEYGMYINNSRATVRATLFSGNGNGGAAAPLYIADANSIVTLHNNAIIDNNNGLYLASDAQASVLHTTIARNRGSGVYVRNGATAIFTNTIISENNVGVSVDAGGALTMNQTLWDNNGTDVVGTVTETGHLDGLALFDTDGYHLTRYSAALGRGVDAGLNDDIDGETRPLPANTAPDMGADEYTFTLEDDLSAEMFAHLPQWIAARDPVSGLPYSYLRQRFLIGLYYGSPDANPPDLTVNVTDTLPAELTFESQLNSPPMDFEQQGQRLVWQTQQPLPVDQTAQVLFSGIAENPEPGQYTNTAEVTAGSWRFDLQDTFEVPLFPPLISTPGNGEICSSSETSGTQVIGMAQGNAIIKLYEGGVEVLTTTAEASGFFSVTYTSTRVGVNALTTLTAMACLPSDPSQCGDPSNPVNLKPIQSFWCPQRSSWTVSAGPYEGTYEFIDPDTGEYATEDWVIVGPHHFPESTISLYLPNPGGQPTAPYITVDSGDPIYPTPPTPTLPPWVYNFPVPMRPYDIIFWNNLDPLENSDGGRLIDPDGYIFDVNKGFDIDNPTLNAVEGVTVTCMVSMTEWGGWVPWPAHLYENQINPQVTGEEGYFAFFTPPGHYYLQVEGGAATEGGPYQAWRSPVVEVISEVVHVNVPYTPWPIEDVSQVILTTDGPDPAVITVPVRSAVEWVTQVNGLIPPEERMELMDNPALRLLSDLDPISFTDGWDGGKMAPGKIFRRQFTTPGTYTYTDGAGHSGQVVVMPYRIYLPLVLRNC